MNPAATITTGPLVGGRLSGARGLVVLPALLMGLLSLIL